MLMDRALLLGALLSASSLTLSAASSPAPLIRIEHADMYECALTAGHVTSVDENEHNEEASCDATFWEKCKYYACVGWCGALGAVAEGAVGGGIAGGVVGAIVGRACYEENCKEMPH